MAATRPPLIALVSATPAAIPPAEGALKKAMPAATLWNIVDDRLLQDAEAEGGITAELLERMRRLLAHAELENVDGVLVTCSIYGGAIARLSDTFAFPVLSADGAAFDAVAALGATTLAVLSSAPAPLQDSVERLQGHLALTGTRTNVIGVVVPGAFEAARSGDLEALASALEASVNSLDGVDAIFLAQYSLSPAATLLNERTGLTVLAGPQMAAASLSTSIGQDGTAP